MNAAPAPLRNGANFPDDVLSVLEKVTGARADRRELNRMLRKIGPGDVVNVTRIDRLARSTAPSICSAS